MEQGPGLFWTDKWLDGVAIAQSDKWLDGVAIAQSAPDLVQAVPKHARKNRTVAQRCIIPLGSEISQALVCPCFSAIYPPMESLIFALQLDASWMRQICLEMERAPAVFGVVGLPCLLLHWTVQDSGCECAAQNQSTPPTCMFFICG
jgi:hypothetical protein